MKIVEVLALLYFGIFISLAAAFQLPENALSYNSCLLTMEETRKEISTSSQYMMLTEETWENDLEAVVDEYKSIASERKGSLQAWQKIFQNASREEQLMRSALQSYKESIRRAMDEIENTRRYAKEVLKHKAALERNTRQLKNFFS
jgi:dsDNA-specific endonuclease/ATPase MutS2